MTNRALQPHIEEVGKVRIHDRDVVGRIDDDSVEYAVIEWEPLGVPPYHLSRLCRRQRGMPNREFDPPDVVGPDAALVITERIGLNIVPDHRDRLSGEGISLELTRGDPRCEG